MNLNDTVVRTDDNNKYLGSALTAYAQGNELKITMFFEHDPDYVKPTNLYLNEVCASNTTLADEKGDFPDWIEVYNGGDRNVDLAGMVVENVTKAVKCTIPKGTTETVVPAHGYRLLWADKTPEKGPLHLNFKLGVSAAETITLTAFYRGDEILLDSIAYEPHETNESFGRVRDGLSDMTIFGICVGADGDTMLTATPLAPNGSLTCETVSVEETLPDEPIVQIYAQGHTICLRNVEKGGQIEVFSTVGTMVAKETAASDAVDIVVSFPGVYIVRVGAECGIVYIGMKTSH